MMTIDQFLMIKVAEEASEVAQRALKMAQFGPDEVQFGQAKSNMVRLLDEYDDLHEMMQQLTQRHDAELDLNEPESRRRQAAKREKLNKYLGLSISLGQVDADS